MAKKKVLIDDDILIQLGKQLEAEKNGETLDYYSSIDEFLAVAKNYSKDTPIYINSLTSIHASKLNFENIYFYRGELGA